MLELHAISHLIKGNNVDRSVLSAFAQEMYDWCVNFKLEHESYPKAETVSEHFEIDIPDEPEEISYVMKELSRSWREEQRIIIMQEAESKPEEDRIPFIISSLASIQLEEKGTTYLTKFEERFNPDDPLNQCAVIGLPTLDAATGGIESGDLVIYLGLVAQGKSTLAKHTAAQNYVLGKRVLIFSLEEDDEIVAHQIDCAIAGVDFEDYYYNQSLTPEQLNDMKAKLAEARKAGGEIIIKSKIDCTTGKVEDRIKAMYAAIVQESPDLVVVDQVPLVAGSIDASEIAKVTRRLKAVCRLTDIPCVALTQSGEEDVEKTSLFSMKYAKAAAEDADKVVFIYKKDSIVHRRAKLLKNRRRKVVDIEVIVKQSGGVLEEVQQGNMDWPEEDEDKPSSGKISSDDDGWTDDEEEE